MGYVLEFRDQPSGNVFAMTPELAFDFFKTKGLQPTFSYADMVREEHDLAFTVAKMLDLDLLKTTKDAVDNAIASGQSLGEFRRDLGRILKSAGWWGTDVLQDPVTGELVEAQLGSAHRLNTIYRSNLQSGYSVGKWQRIQENAAAAPWLMYDAVDDTRTRDAHARLDNTILPVSDPFWRRFMPPNGYGCRCGVIQLRDSDLDRLGLTPNRRRPEVKLRDWKNPRTGQIERIPVATDPGWDHNPGLERFGSIKKLAREKIRQLPDPWQEPAKAAIVEAREFFDGDSPEMEWHRAAFDKSPRAIKVAVQKAGRISVQTGGRGAYAMGGQLIEMGSHKIDSPSGQGVWRHEFGHILDVQIGRREGDQSNIYGYISSNRSWLQAKDKDARLMNEAAGKGRKSKANDQRKVDRVAAYDQTTQDSLRSARGDGYSAYLRGLAERVGVNYDEYIEAMRRETLAFTKIQGGTIDSVDDLPPGSRVRLAEALVALERGDVERFVERLLYRDSNDYKTKRSAYKAAEVLGSLSDLAGATTKNRTAGFEQGFPGHSTNYYRQSPHKAPTEAFANVTNLMSHELPFWHDIARRFAPNQAAEWEAIINRQGDQ